MKFWDASAVLPLCVDESQARSVRQMLQDDTDMVVWWGTPVECHSAFARLRREGSFTPHQEDDSRALLERLQEVWVEIEPSGEVRALAQKLLLSHPLRAADSLQLAAALIWANKLPRGHQLVCFDQRLRDAARKEGFTLMP